MKIAIMGAKGRVGAALARAYARDCEVISSDRHELDLGQLDRVRSVLSDFKFELLLNCAALTNVDYCESHREEAFLVNAEAPRLLRGTSEPKGPPARVIIHRALSNGRLPDLLLTGCNRKHRR
jgi:dTDP-4-dehydrorhamnose reductase